MGEADLGYAVLVGVVAVLNLIGLVMVLSASSVDALREYGSSWFFFRRQVVWVLAGVGLLVIAMRADYRILRRLAVPLLGITIGLLVLVLVPDIGVAANGSRRWIGVGALQGQPSEFAKLVLAVFAADILSRRAVLDHRGRGVGVDPRPVLIVTGVVATLVLMEPDMGTAFVLALIVGAMVFVAGTRLRTMTWLVTVGAAAALAIALVEPYRRARLFSFLNPWSDGANTGYQVVQSLVGLGSGELTGLGLGASRQKWSFLPNAHTDFIFAVIGEELGLIGTIAIVALFGAFAVLGVRTALRAPDRFGMLLATGITAWVVGQAIINMGAVIGILPVTGVPLPFVSFGGSALMITMGATGVLLSIARRAGPART